MSSSTDETSSSTSSAPASKASLPPRKSPWWAKLVLLSFSTLFAIGILEVGLRIVGRGPLGSGLIDQARTPTSSDPKFADAQSRGWIPTGTESEKLAPFPEVSQGFLEFRRSADGLRSDREYPKAPPEGIRRILVLGDSHTEGMVDGEETFAHRLQQRLNQESSSWEVLNGAFRRASPLQEYWAYEQAYEQFEPEAIVVGFFVGNDLMDLLRSSDRLHLTPGADDEWLVTAPTEATNATEDRESWSESLKRPLRRHSAIYRNLTEIRWLREAVVETTGSEYRQRLEAAAAEEPGWVWQAGNQVAYFREHAEDEETAWKQLTWIWRNWKKSTDAANRRLIIVLIPSGMQAHPDRWSERRAKVNELLGMNDEVWSDLDRQYAKALELTKTLGIESIDLLGAIRARSGTESSEEYYYEIDQHLNAAGHALVAELLEKNLSAN